LRHLARDPRASRSIISNTELDDREASEVWIEGLLSDARNGPVQFVAGWDAIGPYFTYRHEDRASGDTPRRKASYYIRPDRGVVEVFTDVI
jgi:hypothetical protein